MISGLRSLILSVALLLISLLVGILGFMFIENYSLTDAFFMTVITVSTVGYNEVQPLSEGGRIFASIYIIFNFGIFAYLVSIITAYIFEGELKRFLKEYRMNKTVNKLKNHVIVCGYGRNGMKVCEELSLSRVEFVLIEKNEQNVEAIKNIYPVIQGEATQDDILIAAGIDRAKAIITTLPSDADNVFITLTAKELNPAIKIISRASEDNSENKLRRAGAHKVVRPDAVGGIHMAQLVTKPYVIEFIDLLTGMGPNGLILDEVAYEDLKEEYQDVSIRDLDIRNKTGATLVGFKDNIVGFQFNPDPATEIGVDDVVILLGKQHEIEKFRALFVRD